jgi:tRNA(fMet)-specific endonuclease VapC
MIYAIDTNIVSYDLADLYGIRQKFGAVLRSGNSIVIPPITYYEIIRGLYVKKALKKTETFNSIYLPYVQALMSQEDWLQAAELYAYCTQNGRTMQEDDLFQAAFCLRHDYTLVTNNVKHFEHIPNLRFEDWVNRPEELIDYED